MSQSSTSPSGFTAACPGCGQRLRFAVAAGGPSRVRVECASCKTVFGARCASPPASGSSPAGPTLSPPPLYPGVPVTAAGHASPSSGLSRP
ncbi:MAG: zinc-ribbon domain-containing protein, partial [Acidobacteriota bacterium]|nr:zinc-ribbon domain-containing protein [Acidobacteriota bacterium]